MNNIAVVGSINVDIVNRVNEFPVPGQTMTSEGTQFFYGGKGANQAVAAARAGGQVSMLGAVGTDPFGGAAASALKELGVDTSGIAVKPGATGMAFITVNAAGQNQIILAPGANASLTPENVRNAAHPGSSNLLLLQNEIPWETNLAVLETAKASGTHVVFNPAPALKLPNEAVPLIGTLVLNESEAEHITGMHVGSADDAASAASRLLERGAAEVIVTLGAEGSLYMNREGSRTYTPAFPAKAVDTTSAGDTFIGYYAVEIASGRPVAEALRMAAAAAALCVTRNGAQASIPSREEVDLYLADQTAELRSDFPSR